MDTNSRGQLQVKNPASCPMNRGDSCCRAAYQIDNSRRLKMAELLSGPQMFGIASKWHSKASASGNKLGP